MSEMTVDKRLETEREKDANLFGIHPDFERLVNAIIECVGKDKLTSMRRDFHTRLRMTLTQPDNAGLIEDLWDFFYDWCVFEQKLPDSLALQPDVKALWERLRGGNGRGLFAVTKAGADGLKLKELCNGKTFVVPKKHPGDFVGIERGDIIEGRVMSNDPEVPIEKAKRFDFIRRPSYHPAEVHSYLKKKVRHFKKLGDFSSYQSWLWLLVGMYLKHRIYHQMPIEKIYDDNSRI
jgi:hypothetical protein